LGEVVIREKAPFPDEPILQVRCLRVEWDLKDTPLFPRKLRLLEVEIESATLIRMKGNRFNVDRFADVMLTVWGRRPQESPRPFRIEEAWICLDRLSAMTHASPDYRRAHFDLAYERFHEEVGSIRELTAPLENESREKVKRFFLFPYLGDAFRSVWD
jgi:hypothetical protein